MGRGLIRAILVRMVLLKTILDTTDMQALATLSSEYRQLATVQVMIKANGIPILGARLAMLQSCRHFDRD